MTAVWQARVDGIAASVAGVEGDSQVMILRRGSSYLRVPRDRVEVKPCNRLRTSSIRARAARSEFAAAAAEWFELGRSAESFAAVRGTTVTAASRRMYRAGRPDLAAPFERAVSRARWASGRK